MILVTGSLAFDYIMDFPGKFSDHIMPDKIHMLNVSFLVPEMRKSFGGTAGNIAYTLALLGVDTAILASVGSDFNKYRDFLSRRGINTKYIQSFSSLYTSTAFGITDSLDNQIWGFYPGADHYTRNLSVLTVKEKIDLGIIAPNNPKAMMKFSHEYARLQIPYLFDPGMQLRWLTKKDLLTSFETAKIIIGNDYEVAYMEKMTGISDLHSLAEKDKIVITTLGAKGSVVSGQGKTHNIPTAKPQNLKDPSGAGDAYRSGFVAGYIKGFPLTVCGRMGALASVYTVEKYGTTTHKFSVSGFEKRYRENFGESLNLAKVV